MGKLDDAMSLAARYEVKADPIEAGAAECESAADHIIAAFQQIGDSERPRIIEQAAKPGLGKVRQGVALVREGFQDYRNALAPARSSGRLPRQPAGSPGGTSGIGAPTPAPSAVQNGWDAPGVVDHPLRPSPGSIHLPDEQWAHILDGDARGGGGHRHGTGRPGKTEYPQRWTDSATRTHVLATATRPSRAVFRPATRKRPAHWRCYGTHDGVTVVAVVRPNGQIRTAFPEPGGRGVVQNPWGRR